MAEKKGKRTSSFVTVRQATLDLLRAFGIDRVFGNPGSTELAFLHNWPNDIDYVLGLQEATVIGMADGYAQATGNAAFVNLHSAAGLGHALGNLFTAYRNKTPLVITAGQQVRSILPLQPYLYAEQAAQFPMPYVKWSAEPARAEDLPAAIARAYYLAMQHPRGPTFVSAPSDDWMRLTRPVQSRNIAAEFGPDLAAIGRLADAIRMARRPAFVVGPAIDRSGSVGLMVDISERAKAAVWASPWSSRASFPELHPLFAGFLPAAPEPLSAALQPYDLIVVFGAPIFTFHVEGRCDVFESGMPFWQITDDPTEAAIAPVGTSIIATVPSALAALRDRLAPAEATPPPPARTAPPPAVARDPIPPEYLLERLAKVLPKDAIVVEEAPSHRPVIQRYLPMPGAGSFYTMASGGLGYGLPASVGVAIARPAKRTVCLIGDGSAMYSIQAIWTAAQRALPLTIIVINNSGYRVLRAFSREMQGENLPGMDLPGLDFVKIAEGLGCRARRIHRAEQIDPALAEGLISEGPMLVEVVVDPAVPALFDIREPRDQVRR